MNDTAGLQDAESMQAGWEDVQIVTDLLLVLDLRHSPLLAPVDAGRCLDVGIAEAGRLAHPKAGSLQFRPATTSK